jgi:hypothetical protein
MFGMHKVGSQKASENIYLYREVHLRAKFELPRYWSRVQDRLSFNGPVKVSNVNLAYPAGLK